MPILCALLTDNILRSPPISVVADSLAHFFFALRRKQLFVLLIEGGLRKNAANVNASRRGKSSATGRIVGKGSLGVKKTAREAQKSRLLQKKFPAFFQNPPAFSYKTLPL